MKNVTQATAGLLALGLTVLLTSPAISARQQAQQQSQQQSQQQQSQQQQSQQQQQQQGSPPSLKGQQQGSQTQGPAEAPKVDPEEEKAYKEFSDLKPDDYDKQIELGETFVTKYPQSRYNELIYNRLTNAYYNKHETGKMYTAADKALALNPDDVNVLVLVGWVIPHSYDPNDLEADRRLEKAETYEKHALEVLPTLHKPDNMTDDEFTAARSKEESTAHAGLGLVYFRQKKAEDSLKELQQATATDQSDPVDFLIMGVDLDSLKRYNDAADAFQKCAQIPSQLQANCKQQAEKDKAQAAQPQK